MYNADPSVNVMYFHLQHSMPLIHTSYTPSYA